MSNLDWNNYAKKGLLQATIDPNDRKGYKNILIDRIHWNALYPHLYGSKNLLDFGCGTGRFAKRIARLGIKYTGVESSSGMVEESRKNNLEIESNFVHFDGIRLPFFENSFDTCLSIGVLQYLIKGPDIDKAMSELQRILVLGGSLILIEQVSLSNKTSGTVEQVSKEIDYINVMSDYFTIKCIKRIRRGNLSRITNCVLRRGEYFPTCYKLIVNLLAIFETLRANIAGDDSLSNIDYYDVFIEAVKNGKRNTKYSC
jgi:SAM-dependent methyltransferase